MTDKQHTDKQHPEVNIPDTAKVLGISEDDVRNLMDAGVLIPLMTPPGSPEQPQTAAGQALLYIHGSGMREPILAIEAEARLDAEHREAAQYAAERAWRKLVATRDAQLAALASTQGQPSDGLPSPLGYEARVRAMAAALHEDCLLEWSAKLMLEPERAARPSSQSAPEPGRVSAWDDLRAEAAVFEAWYTPPLAVNAWVGIDTRSGFYGGWSVEGDPLYDWDESEMTTASGATPEAVIADLIGIAREYRVRCDTANAEEGEPE